MAIDDPVATAEGLRREAGAALVRADRARELALDLERRRNLMLSRVTPSLNEHVTAVWSSQAADRSRSVLDDDVALALRHAADDLDRTRSLLAASAAGLDDEARTHRRAADLLETAAAAPSEPVP